MLGNKVSDCWNILMKSFRKLLSFELQVLFCISIIVDWKCNNVEVKLLCPAVNDFLIKVPILCLFCSFLQFCTECIIQVRCSRWNQQSPVTVCSPVSAPFPFLSAPLHRSHSPFFYQLPLTLHTLSLFLFLYSVCITLITCSLICVVSASFSVWVLQSQESVINDFYIIPKATE